MRNFILVTVLLLCHLSRISVSVSEFHTAEVQPGEEVTMLCSNYTTSPTQIRWFRVVKLSPPSCISQIFTAPTPESYCDGFKNGRFEVMSNVSTIFLKIKQVNMSDSGLYFCGYHVGKNSVIVDATYLEVQEVFNGLAKPMIGILGGLTVFLTVVITGLVVKIKNLKKVRSEEQTAPQTTEVMIQDSGLNYETVTFHPKPKRNVRPAPETEMEPNVIYSATK